MRTNRMLLAAVAAAAAVALTGCGGNDPGTGIPTARETTGTPRAGAATTGTSGAGGDEAEIAAYVEAKRAWVACLREGGIDAPDPDENGQVELTDARAVKANPALSKVLADCGKDLPNVPAALERRLAPKLTPEQIRKQVEFADCMQKNGAPDFPDPEADGHVYGDEQQWDSTTAAAKRAARLCGPIVGRPAETGPGKG
ncbi:hypothetical protein ACFVU3_08685 [Streptomyces sp. NPDC058052]|uniref:hypothetical protein n=1 Tax=Streptomyces sp. NPDC058052 TaxID=3346316 RepID=UPI0036DFD22B